MTLRKIMLAAALGQITAKLPHHPVRVEYLDKPKPPQTPTAKRAKAKAARKQRTKK